MDVAPCVVLQVSQVEEIELILIAGRRSAGGGSFNPFRILSAHAEKGAIGAIKQREWITCLRAEDRIQLPAARERARQPRGVSSEWELVDRGDGEAMSHVELCPAVVEHRIVRVEIPEIQVVSGIAEGAAQISLRVSDGMFCRQ